MYLAKLLLQILRKGSEIAALVLLRPWLIELDTDHGRVAREVLLSRAVAHTCFHVLSLIIPRWKGYKKIQI